jgi:hypothetical protein
MRGAGFHQDLTDRQGLWLTADGIEVELLVPDGLQESVLDLRARAPNPRTDTKVHRIL